MPRPPVDCPCFFRAANSIVQVILSEIARSRRGHFNLLHIDTGFKADIYIQNTDPLDAWAFEHVRWVQVENSTITIAPMECVIVRKLEFYQEGQSEKHLRDIAKMLHFSGDQLDVPTLEGFVQERGLEKEWAMAKNAKS